jgi:hypothetical protein
MEGHVLNPDRCDDFYFNLNTMTVGAFNGIANVYTLTLPNEISTTDRGSVYIALTDWIVTFNSAFNAIGAVYLCCCEVINDPVLSMPVLGFCVTTNSTTTAFGSVNNPNPSFYKVNPLINIGGSSSGVKELHFYFMYMSGGLTTYRNVPVSGLFHGNIRISRSSFDNFRYYCRPGRLRGEKRIKSLK